MSRATIIARRSRRENGRRLGRRPAPAFSLPHRGIRAETRRERLAIELLDGLWAGYRDRVPYARAYERLIREAGGTFRNDHVAFRTFALGVPSDGIFSVARPFEALGWITEGCYRFPDKKLSAVHLRHPNPGLPKVFVSELRVWELSPRARRIVRRSTRVRRTGLSEDDLAGLASPAARSPGLRRRLLGHFERPWPPPEEAAVRALDAESQYAAWTLLFGRRVNHFTASVDSQDSPSLSGIEATVAALRAKGVPMKATVEGAPGSKLRQSATEAATLAVESRARGRSSALEWPYAYFELAERGLAKDAETGRLARFEGFLGGQAAQLFEMTRRR